MDMYYATGWMIFGIIFMIVFWGGLIALVVWAIKRFTTGRTAPGGNPLDIAKERYAKGEITKEQYDQIKRDLS